jgi:hypothetical protein
MGEEEAAKCPEGKKGILQIPSLVVGWFLVSLI